MTDDSDDWIVPCGRPLGNQVVRSVPSNDNSGTTATVKFCGVDRNVGRLVVSGPSVAKGISRERREPVVCCCERSFFEMTRRTPGTFWGETEVTTITTITTEGRPGERSTGRSTRGRDQTRLRGGLETGNEQRER